MIENSGVVNGLPRATADQIAAGTAGPAIDSAGLATYLETLPIDIVQLTPPSPADFPTWLNQSFSTFSSSGGKTVFNCYRSGGTSTVAIRAVLKPFNPLSNRVFTCALRPFTRPTTLTFGFCLYDSVLGNLLIVGSNAASGSANIVANMLTATSITGTPTSVSGSTIPLFYYGPVFYRLTVFGRSVYVGASVDGLNWYDASGTTYLVYDPGNFVPDYIGPCVNAQSTTLDGIVLFDHWAEA